jgi:type IV secretion system protein VirB8
MMKLAFNTKGAAPITADALEQYKKERQGLELDLTDEILESRKRAWTVSRYLAGITVAALGLAGFVIWRYAQPLPEHMLIANPQTGSVEQVSIVPGGKATTYGELVDSYWIGQFVIHHEGYEFYTAQDDYDFVNLTTTGNLHDTYISLWGGSKAPDKVLGDSEMTTVHIESVIPDEEHKIATVRYTTTKKYKNRPQPEPTVYWIATIAYDYQPGLMNPKQRFINPLGFKVLSFRPNTEASEG